MANHIACRRVRKRPIAEINVIPYIDVMLVLLIVFMISAPLLSQGVKVELPQVASEPLSAEGKEPVIVSVDANGDMFINYGENQDKPLTPDTLVKRVRALMSYQPGLPVLVKGDRNVAYGKVVGVMSLLQGAGVSGLGLMTRSPETGVADK